MFPAESADADPYNYPPPSDPHYEPSSSPSANATTISADNASLYLHQHHHHHSHHHPHLYPHQQQSLQQWPHASYYSASSDMAAPGRGGGGGEERMMIEGHQYTQQAAYTGNLSREEAQLFVQQPHAVQFQGRWMMPAVDQQYYNEQLLRSLSHKGVGAGPQLCGVEPRSIYGNHEELQSTSSRVLNRTLESIGRSSEPAAGYEEAACTPRPRWCPTQEQIQILESLFSSGTTTPSRDMIVDIAAQLRNYGTIAEANVFYWFQNRKARAKRKLQPRPAPYTGASSAS